MTALVLLPRSSPSEEKQFHRVVNRAAISSSSSVSARRGKMGSRHVAETDLTSSSESARLKCGREI